MLVWQEVEQRSAGPGQVEEVHQEEHKRAKPKWIYMEAWVTLLWRLEKSQSAYKRAPRLA